MFLKETSPPFCGVLKLGNRALKAPCVNRRPQPPAHIEATGLITLLMPISLPCWVWHCDPRERGNEVKLAVPAPQPWDFRTSRATVFMLLVLGFSLTHIHHLNPVKSDLVWSDKWSMQEKERHVISVWIQQSWGYCPTLLWKFEMPRMPMLRGLRPLGE